MRPCNEAIEATIKLTETMLSLSDRGDQVREDSGCGILYGILRDSAFKIRKAAEAEKESHIKNKKWE